MGKSMIEPKEITIKDQGGNDRKYIISKIPYLSGGREICTQYISSAMPKVGDYKLNEELCRKMFKFISVELPDGNPLPLTTESLVNNHVPDFVSGLKLEEAMLEYQVGFSVTGKLREFQAGWKAELPELITKTLTVLKQSLQAQTSAPSTNSARSTQ